jgi:hypothetical protein
MDYIIARLQERSTWQGVIAIAGAFGVTLDPNLTIALFARGIAAVVLIIVLWPVAGAPASTDTMN